MFEVIHSILLVPFIAGGIVIGSTCGPLLGAVDGFNAWRKVKEAHQAEVKKADEDKSDVSR